MEYQKTNIVAFAGLEVNKRPELIEDQQASDIENLRFDKLGYLVNRNGVKVRRIYETRTVFSDLNGDLWPIGTVGFGEYVVEQPFGISSPVAGVTPYDDASLALVTDASQTDRFLVAAIRLPTNNHPYYTDSYNYADSSVSGISDALNWRYKMAYVLIPQTGTGSWTETFAFAPNGGGVSPDPDNSISSLYATVGSRVISRPDDTPATMQIYAPARRLGDHNSMSEITEGVPGSKWIDNYVQMRQYRKSVTIADRTNGDLQLIDEIHEADYDQEKQHRFSLRQNAVVEFDVDDVVIDFGVGEGGFNEGVEAPMVLYRYYLNRRRGISTTDNFTPYYTRSATKSPSLEKSYLTSSAWKTRSIGPNPFFSNVSETDIFNIWVMPEASNAFMYTEVWYGEGDGIDEDDYKMAGLSINSVNQYTFTMNEYGEEIDDLFSKLRFENPDAGQEEGKSISPYRWEDLLINYYPVSGKDQDSFFLTAYDRDWEKIDAGPKIIELQTKVGLEQRVPLGVWRYRFVWDMGNGDYSTASSELVVPDLLFSAMRDDEVVESAGVYMRPFGLSSESDAYRSAFEIYSYTTNAPSVPYFINDQSADAQGSIRLESSSGLSYDTETAYSRNFTKVKQALYEPDHIFGAKESSTSGQSWPADWKAEGVFANGQFSVIGTVFFPDDLATLSGVFAETAVSNVNGLEDDISDYSDVNFNFYKAQAVQLLVPLFGSYTDPDSHMFNSLFSDTGAPRVIYQNKASNSLLRGYDASVPSYQIVFSGASRFGFGLDDPESTNIGCDVAEGSSNIYFNLVPVQRYTGVDALSAPIDLDLDLNNVDGTTIFDDSYTQRERREIRNHTVVRGVRDETHRLLKVKDGVPPEVLSRVIVQGTAEFTLASHGDLGCWLPQFSRLDSYSENNQLKHELRRQVLDIESLVYSDQQPALANPWWSNDIQANYPFYYTKVFGGPGTFTFTKSTTDFSNLKVVVSGRGERLTIPEQLTSFFPASVVFEAPHLKLSVPADRVPRRARRLMIFRTRASHDNAWQPHEYGLAKAIDIIRDANGDLTGDHQNNIKFLDDVKSADLDFSFDLNTYEAFTRPLKSRFCLPLNERVYYGNFVETYRPRRPRTPVLFTKDPADGEATSHINTSVPPGGYAEKLWSWVTAEVNDQSVNTLPAAEWLYYFLAYEDAAGAVSLQSFSGPIDRTQLSSGGTALDPSKVRVVMYCLPSQYDPIVDKARIYRLATETPIPEIRPYPSPSVALTAGRVYYVAQGVVEYNGDLYYPTDVIRATDATDTGVDPSLTGVALDAFKGTGTYTGIHGTHGDFILYDLTDHLGNSATGPYIEKIETIEPEAEGVFYDDDKPSLGRLQLRDLFPNLEDLESGIRWSEPYTPNKIKLGSLIEVRAGDGDQITGMEALYGNIVVLKERSIHRLAVQAAGVPVSRVDEISNTVGCIAPNTVLCINNEMFFLSWSGFYRYNNNVLQKMDIPFSEELQLRLRNGMNGEPDPAIRDASCAWNPTYREIYLNIPIMSSVRDGAAQVDEYDSYVALTDNMGTRQVRGTVYALNIDTGLATKFRYMDDSRSFGDTASALTPLADAATQRSVRTQAKLYHTTSLGKLMSADVLPARTVNYITTANPQEKDKSRYWLDSTFYYESPTKQDFGQFDKEDDEFLYYRSSLAGFGGTAKQIGRRYVRTFWKSKTWTAEDKSVLKRFRKAFAYMAAASQPVIMRGVTHTSPEGSTEQTFTTWVYQFDSGGQPVTGELMAVPAEAHSSNLLGPAINRGERYTFEIETGGRTQIEYFGFYWKPINMYER